MSGSNALGTGVSVPDETKEPRELLYRSFFEHSPTEVHFWRVVRDSHNAIVTWRLLDANPAALASWGRRLEDVVGRTTDEIFPGADPVRTFRHVVEEIMASGQPKHWEITFGGTAQVLRMVSVPVGDCFLSTGVDVSSERARQQELEQALQRVTQATRAGGVGLWDWDLRTQSVHYSDEWKRQLGYAPEEIADSFEEWRSRVHPADLEPTLAAASAALDDPRRSYDVTLRMRHRDGSYRWILGQGSVFRDEAGRPYRMVGSQIDITEQRRLKADLELERNKHGIMLRNSSDGMCIINEGGFIEEVSDSFGSMLGYERDEMLGMHISQWEASPDAAGVDAVVAQTIAGGRRVQFETCHRRKDGVVLDVEVSAVPFELDGRVLLFCLTRDIAERKKVQSELEAARKNLEEQVVQRTAELSAALMDAQSANRAKNLFLSSMSHELRTPLHAVLGYAQLALTAPLENLAAPQRTQVEHIEASANHLLSLVNDLLDLARIESGALQVTIQPVDVGAKLAKVFATLAPMADSAGIELIVDSPGPDCWVHADALRLRQCLINLVSNGIKYNRRGGLVRLGVRREAPGIVIEVQDNGRGMRPEQVEMLFQRFNRLGLEASDIGGTGIGLAVTRELVQQMHGRISVTSSPGVGSTFCIWLPSAPPPCTDRSPLGPPVERQAAASTKPAAGQLSVVYVEDNEVNVTLMEAMVAMRPNICLSVARSGAEAMPLIARVQPLAVLMDMHLGDCDGIELLERLRADHPEAKRTYVAVSADASADQIGMALSHGFDRYLTKPLQLDTLLALLDELGSVPVS